MTSPSWTRVVLLRNVVERFLSGFLDKVVHDCKAMNDTQLAASRLAISHYYKYGFSCNKHGNFESFLSFMETVPAMEGHFSPQTPLCGFLKFPHTDVIIADKNLDTHLRSLSQRLKVSHPPEDERTTSHAQGAKGKMSDIFRGRDDLLQRIIALFHQDCIAYSQICEVPVHEIL